MTSEKNGYVRLLHFLLGLGIILVGLGTSYGIITTEQASLKKADIRLEKSICETKDDLKELSIKQNDDSKEMLELLHKMDKQLVRLEDKIESMGNK